MITTPLGPEFVKNDDQSGAKSGDHTHREARADAEVAVVPMADGGEGTLDAALANGYERREAVVHGPLGAPLRASFA
jgi:glycerate kinase